MKNYLYIYASILCITLETNIFSYNPKKELTIGQTVTVEFPANLTTGYNWQVACIPENSLAITQQYQKPAVDPGLVGHGGKTIFNITAKQSGNVTCVFTYSRPWEKNKVPVQTHTYLFCIEENKHE